MIGNDIVDLIFANQNSRWQEQRFLDKLFSEEEQEFILSNGSRFHNIWHLWSMKESAYKIIARGNRVPHFNPKDFKCFSTHSDKGQVIFQNKSIPTVTQTHRNFIQTTAYIKPEWMSKVFQFINTDYKVQNTQSYQCAAKSYAELKNLSPDTIEVIKNDMGVPQFYVNGNLQEAQLSLSHHGCFGALAIAD